MGAGIAEVSARAGVDVLVFETTDALVTAGRNRITKSLERAVSAGKVTEREKDAALAKLKFTTALSDLADRQLVIEAVIEDEAVKSKIFWNSIRSSPTPTRCSRRTRRASRS